ncbi:Pyrophosphatase PpaX [compost metagenome]
MRNYFCSIVGRDRVGRGKPDPEMVTLALREMRVSTEECILIGDSNGDMIMAKRAGLQAAIGIAGDIASGEEYLLDADLIVTGYSDMTVQLI